MWKNKWGRHVEYTIHGSGSNWWLPGNGEWKQNIQTIRKRILLWSYNKNRGTAYWMIGKNTLDENWSWVIYDGDMMEINQKLSDRELNVPENLAWRWWQYFMAWNVLYLILSELLHVWLSAQHVNTGIYIAVWEINSQALIRRRVQKKLEDTNWKPNYHAGIWTCDLQMASAFKTTHYQLGTP